MVFSSGDRRQHRQLALGASWQIHNRLYVPTVADGRSEIDHNGKTGGIDTCRRITLDRIELATDAMGSPKVD